LFVIKDDSLLARGFFFYVSVLYLSSLLISRNPFSGAEILKQKGGKMIVKAIAGAERFIVV